MSWREEEVLKLRSSQLPTTKAVGLSREGQCKSCSGGLKNMKNIKNKQKLDRRNTYTPTAPPQARCNCGPLQNGVLKSLNREETLSVPGLKTLSNNPDVDLRSGMTGRGLRVPVINMRNKPLMPTTPGKTRKLLEKGKAKVVQRTPFTIQLLYAAGGAKQPVKLGIDTGYKHVGFSVVTEKAELISGEAVTRTGIPKLNEEKAMYRRNRRNKLWYRKPSDALHLNLDTFNELF